MHWFDTLSLRKFHHKHFASYTNMTKFASCLRFLFLCHNPHAVNYFLLCVLYYCFQFSADPLSSPSLIRPMIETNYDDLDYIDFLDSDETPLPLEVYLNKVANKLRSEVGSFKDSGRIEEDIAETIEFMKTVAAGGVSNKHIHYLSI